VADVTQVLSGLVLAQEYRGNVVRQVNRRAVALKLDPWKPGSGKNVAFAPIGSGVVAEFYNEGADATNFGSDAQASALLPWASCRALFHLSGLAQAAAATSSTPLGNIELWASNMVSAAGQLCSIANAAFYNGTGVAPNPVGLDVAIGSVSNTYAGIDRSIGANAYFRPNVFSDNSKLSFDLIRGDMAAIYIASGDRPDIALCSPNTLKAFQALFDPQKLYLAQTVEVETARGKVTLDAGIPAIKFDGCYFFEDKDCPDTRIEYLNSQYVHIEYLPMDLSGVPGLSDEVENGLEADDGFGVTPLGMRLEMLAKTGDSDKCQLKSYLQTVVTRPNACGRRTAFTL